MNRETERRTQRLREQALRLGYRLSKGRLPVHPHNQGQYQLTDIKQKTVVLGERYEASLDAIEQYLKEHGLTTRRKGQ